MSFVNKMITFVTIQCFFLISMMMVLKYECKLVNSQGVMENNDENKSNEFYYVFISMHFTVKQPKHVETFELLNQNHLHVMKSEREEIKIETRSVDLWQQVASYNTNFFIINNQKKSRESCK
ncbi:CLUMA_CG009614, isoform A [Clunio marinus]|uniref:CLUMA_CG009614, isoform A n=1 Tax=Clunio marinus TaxID=568069 RepID=A0A1J1ICL9_9DIPT|nr:CLUMA_CG009614, isoform A [Clunio marinus]